MGNVRTDQIKRTAKELIRRFPNRFSNSFDENKLQVKKLLEGASPKVRNQIAGYLTRCLACEETATADEATEEGEDD